MDTLDRRPGNTMRPLDPNLQRFNCDVTRKVSNHHLGDRIEVVNQHFPTNQPMKDRPVGKRAVDCLPLNYLQVAQISCATIERSVLTKMEIFKM